MRTLILISYLDLRSYGLEVFHKRRGHSERENIAEQYGSVALIDLLEGAEAGEREISDPTMEPHGYTDHIGVWYDN